MGSLKGLPERREQILGTHAELIRAVVGAVHNRELLPALEHALTLMEAQGWDLLVRALRLILSGHRDASLLAAVDEDDRVILQAVLQGLQDPSSLPKPLAPDPSLAAPGLASLLSAALRGDPESRDALEHMTAQMGQAGGALAQLSAALRLLLQGEQRPERLTRNMGAQGRQLVLALLDEVAKRNLQ